LPHNLKFKQQPKCFEITKTLKENVDTTTTVSSQTSSHLKSKGNNNFSYYLYPAGSTGTFQLSPNFSGKILVYFLAVGGGGSGGSYNISGTANGGCGGGGGQFAYGILELNSGDTLNIINYTHSIGTSYTHVETKQIKLILAYQYCFFPTEKATIKVGGGIDFGYIYKGFFRGDNSVYSITRSTAAGMYAGEFYNTSDNQGFSKSFSGGFSVRPYADITVSWRLSKKNKVLDNISLFTTARMGYDCIKLRNSSMYNNLFTSTTFGISYIFDKYYKS
jgi:hypothetical protein